MKAIALLAVLTVAGGGEAQTKPPARAQSAAACIWSAVTPKMRAAMLTAAPSLNAMLDAISADQAQALARRCNVPDTEDGAGLVALVLRGHTLADWAARTLKAKYHVDRAALDAEWAKLPAKARAEFASAFDEDVQISPASDRAVAAMGDALNIPRAEDAQLVLFDYAAGRALVEAAEAD